LELTQETDKVLDNRRRIIIFDDGGKQLDMRHIILAKHRIWERHKDIVSNQLDVLRKPLLGRTLRQGNVDCVDGSGGWNFMTELDGPNAGRVASVQRCAIRERTETTLPGASADICYLQVILFK